MKIEKRMRPLLANVNTHTNTMLVDNNKSQQHRPTAQRLSGQNHVDRIQHFIANILSKTIVYCMCGWKITSHFT